MTAMGAGAGAVAWTPFNKIAAVTKGAETLLYAYGAWTALSK